MKKTGSPPPSWASAATSSRLGSAVQSTASGRASGGVMGPPFQTNGVVAPNASRASRRAMERRNGGTTAKRARQTGGSGRPGSSPRGMATTRARRARPPRKAPRTAGVPLHTQRVAPPGSADQAAPTDPAPAPPPAGVPAPPAGRAPARPSRLLPSHDPRLSKGDPSGGMVARGGGKGNAGWARVASPYLFGLSSRA